MRTTDGPHDHSSPAAAGSGDLDLAALERVTAAAREYAGATSRLANAYLEYARAVRTLSSAQQAVQEAAQAMAMAERDLHDGGIVHAPLPQVPAAGEADVDPRATTPAPPTRMPEPEMTDESESSADYSATVERAQAPAGADTTGLPGAPASAAPVDTLDAEDDLEDAGLADRPSGAGMAAAEETEQNDEPVEVAPAPPPRREEGIKVIPRFLGNPPPARANDK